MSCRKNTNAIGPRACRGPSRDYRHGWLRCCCWWWCSPDARLDGKWIPYVRYPKLMVLPPQSALVCLPSSPGCTFPRSEHCVRRVERKITVTRLTPPTPPIASVHSRPARTPVTRTMTRGPRPRAKVHCWTAVSQMLWQRVNVRVPCARWPSSEPGT